MNYLTGELDMKKGAILTILLIFLTLPFASGQNILGAESQATISPLGEAVFQTSVTNNGNNADIFFLELSDVLWSLRTENTPDFTTGIALSAGESKNIKVYIKPGTTITPGTYFVELRATSENTNEHTGSLFMIRVDAKYVDYNINIASRVLEPTSIDPEKTSSIKVLINNSYPVYLENITIEAKSKFLNKKTNVDFAPLSEKVIDFSLGIDKSVPQQEDPLTITVTQLGKEISKTTTTLYIKEYKLDYRVDITTTDKFLHTIKEITFTNTEGGQKTQDAHLVKPDINALIITSPQASTVEFNNEDYLVWREITLNPNESYKVIVVEDYRPTAAVGLLILILIISYFVFRSPIIVRKKGYGIHKKDTGNNEIKVVIQLKNRTGKYIEKVRVLERLPFIQKVQPDFGPGTPEPKFRRQQGHQGVVLDWDIALAPNEERIFSYKMKSALPLVGEYELRPTVVQYGHKGRRVTSESYRLFIE